MGKNDFMSPKDVSGLPSSACFNSLQQHAAVAQNAAGAAGCSSACPRTHVTSKQHAQHTHVCTQIANRIKAKGLQKLRWYCQLCQKQCRDENGFKCHQMSEGHRRQMDVFGQNAGRFISGFSEEFQESFLDHMKRA